MRIKCTSTLARTEVGAATAIVLNLLVLCIYSINNRGQSSCIEIFIILNEENHLNRNVTSI